jgi:hypothetical protein
MLAQNGHPSRRRFGDRPSERLLRVLGHVEQDLERVHDDDPLKNWQENHKHR